MKQPKPSPQKVCSKCQSTIKLVRCAGGYVCDECTQAFRTGRDETTQVIKENLSESRSKTAISLREAKLDVVGLLPEVVMNDAANHRSELLSYGGNDCAAMAMAAELDCNAENSLEKMLAHQMAVCHKAYMEITAKAFYEEDALNQARLMHIANLCMASFQKALLTMQRIKSGGGQNIVVKHVSVSEGGQAVIGNIQGGSVL